MMNSEYPIPESSSNPDNESEEQIPFPWERHYSAEDNTYYLYNPITNECLWEEIFSEYAYNDEYIGPLDDGYSVGNSEISKTTLKSGINDPNLTVVERSNITIQSKQAKIQKIQQEKLMKEAENLKLNPEITKKSKSMTRSINDMIEWETKRKLKLQQQVEKMERQQAQQLKAKPTITQKAQQMYKDSDLSFDGTVNDNYETGSLSFSVASKPVVDRLMEYEERKNAKIMRLRQEEMLRAKLEAVPRLAPHSSRLIRKDNQQDARSVGERLYEQAQSRGHDEFFSAGKLASHDENTGQRLFEPVLNNYSAKIAARNRNIDVPIEEQLWAKGREYQQKIQEKERQKILQHKQLSEISKTNAVSERIVLEKEYYEGETTQDRLSRPIGNVKPKILQSMSQPTFKPKISEQSMQILAQSGYSQIYLNPSHDSADNSFQDYYDDIYYGEAVCVDGNEVTLLPKKSQQPQQNANSKDLYSRFTLWDEQRKRRLELDRQHKEMMEMSQCSFKPQVKPYLSSAGGKSSDHSSIELSERHAEWAKRRDDRLAKERVKLSENQLKECTFVPKVPLPQSVKSRSLQQPHNTSTDLHLDIVNREPSSPEIYGELHGIKQSKRVHFPDEGAYIYTQKPAKYPQQHNDILEPQDFLGQQGGYNYLPNSQEFHYADYDDDLSMSQAIEM